MIIGRVHLALNTTPFFKWALASFLDILKSCASETVKIIVIIGQPHLIALTDSICNDKSAANQLAQHLQVLEGDSNRQHE